MEKPKKVYSLLVKPAGANCNLNCTYCFYLEKNDLFAPAKKLRMSDDTLKKLYMQIGEEAYEYLSFTWQGGEPSLMGLPFYKNAMKLNDKYCEGVFIDYGFQTNAILLNKYWAKFFADNSFLLGVSLDGPEHIHDKYRKDIGGKGTFNTAFDNLKMLLDHDVKVNVLGCVNDYSVDFPEETYNFYKSSGLDFMQFIPILEPDKNNPEQAASYSVPPEKYGEFLCKIFDLWMNDFKNGKPGNSVRNFESVFFNYAGFESPECTFQDECGKYLVIEYNGNVYPCDFFVEEELCLGNIHKDKLSQMLNTGLQNKFGHAKAVRKEECSHCPWLTKCYGGCIKDRVKNPADRHHFYFCESYKMFYNHADEQLKRLAAEWKANNNQI